MELILRVSNSIFFALWLLPTSLAFAGDGPGHTHGPTGGFSADWKVILAGVVVVLVVIGFLKFLGKKDK